MTKADIAIAVTSRTFSKHPVLKQELLARFSNVRFNDQGLKLVGPDLIQFLSGIDRAITALEVFDETVLEALPTLTVISKFGVGLDMLDMTAMRDHNVSLGWTPGVNRRSVAELALTMMLSTLGRATEATTMVKAGTWKTVSGRLLTGKTVGVIGCGHIGKDLVKLLAPFGCRIIVFDCRDYPDFYAEWGIEPVFLEVLLSTADVVTLHLPLDRSTEGMLNADRLAMMKRGAVLINTARGGLVDEGCLKTMLQSGHLAGAGFDVFLEEPPQDQDLINLANFMVTPHIGGSSEEAILSMGRAAIDGLEAFSLPDPALEGVP